MFAILILWSKPFRFVDVFECVADWSLHRHQRHQVFWICVFSLIVAKKRKKLIRKNWIEWKKEREGDSREDTHHKKTKSCCWCVCVCIFFGSSREIDWQYCVSHCWQLAKKKKNPNTNQMKRAKFCVGRWAIEISVWQINYFYFYFFCMYRVDIYSGGVCVFLCAPI